MYLIKCRTKVVSIYLISGMNDLTVRNIKGKIERGQFEDQKEHSLSINFFYQLVGMHKNLNIYFYFLTFFYFKVQVLRLQLS